MQEYLHRSHIGAHGAMADTLATMQLLKKMVRGFLELGTCGSAPCNLHDVAAGLLLDVWSVLMPSLTASLAPN